MKKKKIKGSTIVLLSGIVLFIISYTIWAYPSHFPKFFVDYGSDNWGVSLAFIVAGLIWKITGRNMS